MMVTLQMIMFFIGLCFHTPFEESETYQISIYNNLLNLETWLMCICMCFYAYVPFSKYAEESLHNAVTNEIANDFNIKCKSSGKAES